jgi:hypothetical protein
MKLKGGGARCVVLGLDNTIVLKHVKPSKEKDLLRKDLARFRVIAEKSGFSGNEIHQMIETSRKKKQSSR